MDTLKWFEQPNIVSLIVLWKYVLNYSYTEIVAKLRDLRIVTTKHSIESQFRNWGLSSEISKNVFQSKFSEEDVRKELDKILGFKIQSKPPRKKKENLETILVTSDYHSPFYRRDMVEYIINNYAGRVSKLVIAGDFFDHYSISRYVPYNLEIDLMDEFRISIALVQQLANHFDIDIISGNHDDRIYKYFLQRIGKEYMFLVNYDWIKYVSEKFINVNVCKNIIGNSDAGKHELNHCTMIGNDCAVGHFEVSGTKTTILKGSQKVEEWIKRWRKYLPELSNCKLVLQAHTHKLGKAFIDGGEKAIGETGCMYQIQEYEIRPDAKYDPGIPGWWIIKQENEETLINESNPYLWE